VRIREGRPSLLAMVVARGAQRTLKLQHPARLFTTLGRHASLFRGWLFFASRLMPGGKLPRREAEMVILRVAHLRDCAYEWEHHDKLGRRAGADPERVKAGPDGWPDREAALLTAVDELHHTQDLSDETWSRLSEHYDDRRLIELVMLVGHYEMLATTIHALRIPADRQRTGQA
jgi:AhpD family alkylhydroperoxidase